MKKAFSRHETGRSMIEMIGVLAIIGVLTIGGIMGFSAAMSKYKTQKAVDDMQLMVSNLREMLYARKVKERTDTETWYHMGLFSKDAYDTTRNKGISTFGGDIEVETVYKNGKNLVLLTYTDVPDYLCRTLAGIDFDAGDAALIQYLKIDQTEFSWTAQDFDKQLPVSTESALAACKGLDNSGNVTMIWMLNQ